MSDLNREIWKIAELRADPRRLFLLWTIHKGFALSTDEFNRHFGKATEPMLSALLADGAIALRDGVFYLTEIGEEVVSGFREAVSRYRSKTAEDTPINRELSRTSLRQPEIWELPPPVRPLPAWKRSIDIFALIFFAPLYLPIIAAIALWIRFHSAGAVLFRQERIGLGGRQFTCFKFRTMWAYRSRERERSYAEMNNSSVPMENSEPKPRLIRGGSFLRRSGLDELPQLLNIVKGEMTLVGPRPSVPYEYAMFNVVQRGRLSVTPGLTGLWQVSGRNQTTYQEMIELDLQYARQTSFRQDLKILAKSIPTFLQFAFQPRSQRFQTRVTIESYHLRTDADEVIHQQKDRVVLP